MAKVLRWSRKRLIVPRTPMVNRSVIELQTAKEILCEIFDIRPCEADEMIRQRLEEGSLYDLEFHLAD
jgi:hypothetical protein